MRTRRALCPAGAPASLERSPPLPLAHRTGLRALPQGPSGPEGQRLAQGPPCGTHHRLHHAGGNRHWPQGPEETPPPWLHTPREQPRPGLPCPVPAPLRPWSRSPHPSASQALGQASATALTRRAHEQRCSGPHRPAFPGVLHPWGRPRPDHPPIPALVPGGGRATDRDAWLPSRAPCVVPVHALAPIARARCHAARRHAGRRAQRDPQGWARPWHGHRHATPTGPTSVTDRAPEVCPVAIAHRRMGRRTDRPVPCTSRTPDRARPRPLPLDAMALLRRCLPHGWPDGVRTGRPVGCLPARWPRAPDTIRPMRSRTIDAACPPPPRTPARLPRVPAQTGGGHLRVVPRGLPSPRACCETGEGHHAWAPAHVMPPPSPSVAGQGRLRPAHRTAWHRGVREAPHPVRQGLSSAMRAQQAVQTAARAGTDARTAPLAPTVPCSHTL